jgi:uncharacterized protein YcfJ
MTKRTLMILGGYCVLGAVAIAGWFGRDHRPLFPDAYSSTQAESPRAAVATVAPERTYVERAPVQQARTVQVVKKRRSTRRSAAIIAGTSGAGAAIGGIAKGGKGAAIGAISGAAGGFFYDALTRDR